MDSSHSHFNVPERVEQTASDGTKVMAYPSWYLILLWCMGHKIAPTYVNSKHFNYGGMATQEELDRFNARNIMQLIYLNPDFWNIERIQKEAWRFEGVRGLSGKTYLRDKNGEKTSDLLLVMILDIDSKEVLRLCREPLENDWLKNTFVIKTYDEWGYRVTWLEEWKEDLDYVYINGYDCINEANSVEIMLGKQYQQIAGAHRDHLEEDFRYENNMIGCQNLQEPALMLRTGLYDQLVNVRLAELLYADEVKARRKNQLKSKDPYCSGLDKTSSDNDNTFSNFDGIPFVELDEWQIHPITSWICKFYGLNNHYNLFMMACMGTIAWHRFSFNSVCKIIHEVVVSKGIIGANTESKWCDTASRAFERLVEGTGSVAGADSLKRQLVRSSNNKMNLKHAEQEVENFVSILKAGSCYDPHPFKTKSKKGFEIPEYTISVSEAIKKDEGIHRVRGIVAGIEGKLQKLVTHAGYRCIECGIINAGHIGEISNDDRPNIFQKLKAPSKCVNCAEETLYLDDNYTKYINTIIIELRNTDDYSEVDTIRTVLFNDLQNDIVSHLGETVEIEGSIHVLLESGKWKRYPFLYANSIKFENDERFIISNSDIDEIKAVAQEHGEDVIDFLVENRFAIDIIGNSFIKKVLLLSAASTSLDIEKDKLHVALLGEVGLAKTLLLRRAVELVNKSVIQSAQNASGLSLTVIVEFVNGIHMVRLGVIPSAKGAICALNEGGGMYFKDQIYLLDCMEEQFFSYAKYGLKGRILSPTVIIWSSNPLSGKFKDPDKIDMDEFPALKALIDRFGLIFVLRDKIDLKQDEEYAHVKLKNWNAKEEFVEKRKKYTLFLKKYIEYSKRFDPVLSPEATQMINIGYCSIRHLHYGSPRILDDLILISTMIARLKLKNEVDGRDVEEAQRLFNKVLEPLGQMINVTTDPINDLVEICKENLRISKTPWKFNDLLEHASKDLLTTKYKFLVEAIEKHKWRTYDEVFLRLSNQNNIVVINKKPRILVWQEIEEGSKQITDSTESGAQKGVTREEFYNNSSSISPISPTSPVSRGPLNHFFKENISEKMVEPPCEMREMCEIDEESLQKNVPQTKTGQASIQESKQKEQAPFEETYKDLKNCTSIDAEWHFEDDKEGVYCVCFYPSVGEPIKLHLQDFNNDEGAFIDKTIEIMQQFNLIVGHNLFGRNSDLDQLSLMYYTKSKLSDQKLKYQQLEKIKSKIIDTYQVFKMQYIKDSFLMNGIEYETNKLNDIANAYLGKGKLDDLTGPEAEALPKEKQIEYCLRDAQLALELLKKNNWEVIQTLWNINSLAKMDFLKLCNVDYVSNIGERILTTLGYTNAMVPRYIRENKVDYSGGEVIDPIRGIHKDIITLDCKSMYPRIVSEWNLSSETLYCVCCKDDPNAQLPLEVMSELNQGLIAKRSQPMEHIWVCQKHRGKFAECERRLIELKEEYASNGEINKSKAMKLVANSLYGMFQLLPFRYTDQRIGFIITAFGRTIIKTLQKESCNYGLTTIYGDTDSIFIKPNLESRLDDFIKMADIKCKVNLAVDKEWKLLLLKLKKGYFGITKDNRFIRKKIHGLKSDATPQQKELVESIARREILESFVENKEKTQSQLLDTIRHIFKEMEENVDDKNYIQNNLAFSFEAHKALNEYNRDVVQTVISKELLVEDKCIGAGKIYQYYKIKPINYKDENGKNKQKKFSIYPDKYELDLNIYREGLFNCVKNILDLFDLDVVDLEQELVKKSK
jgi:DNA replicative helicase MCM subunit Mcm2 (Cdc46/Mcm family)/DNA polymerase elongation subunit (family B)